MLDAKLSSPALLLLLVGVVAAGCGEPQCPSGYTKKGDTCYRPRDAGLTEAGTAGNEDLDASDVQLEDSSSGVVSGDAAMDGHEGERDPGSAPDATSLPDGSSEPGDGSSDPCQGSGGAAVCIGAAMHHCSPQGETESTENCASAQECQLGIASVRCAPCTPGKFQCKEARLERCANDGSGWELFTTCDSAPLCNATAGACTDKACTPMTRVCTGDTLNGCNESLTALAPIMTCDAGMCDQAQGECDVCVANAKECQGNVAVTCDANGRQASRNPCQGTTPRCTGNGRCVECVNNSDCRGEHELCVDNHCDVQPYCGDGRVTAGEACDPADPRWNVWTCNAGCQETTVYTACRGTTAAECGTGEFCSSGVCISRCNVPGDCPPPPTGTNIAVSCFGSDTAAKYCMPSACSAATDCAPGLVCGPTTVGGLGSLCVQCSSLHPCPAGSVCRKQSPDDKFSHCVAE